MERYTIGEFARRMGVSTDFIKYYEKYGLLQSYQDPSNRYHYYDFSQSQLVLAIQYLRGLGFSAKEIVDLAKAGSQETVIGIFQEKKEEVQKEIFRQQYVMNQLHYYTTALHVESPGTWYVVQTPALYFLPHTTNENYIQNDLTTQLIREWSKYIPYVYGLDRWIYDADTKKSCYPSMQHGRAIDAALAKELGLSTESPVLLLPEQRCIVYHLQYVHKEMFQHSPELTLDKYQEAFDLIQSKDFQICGDMLVKFISLRHENGREYEQDILYIPIR
jgi:DNA-binding transcriptional MerR regulator